MERVRAKTEQVAVVRQPHDDGLAPKSSAGYADDEVLGRPVSVGRDERGRQKPPQASLLSDEGTMGGIVNYHHGETGVISDVHTILEGHELHRCLELVNNPHRDFAFDYGADILIDPRLRRGDRVVFVRLAPYDGVWVHEENVETPNVVAAAELAAESRGVNKPEDLITVRAPDIWAEEAPSFPIAGQTVSERPATEASFFISYSSENVMLARSIVRDLRYDTKLDIWFDLELECDPENWSSKRAERWLREGVFSSKAFLLLLTDAAASSRCVAKEFEWARERCNDDGEFKFIILKLSDVPLPIGSPDDAVIIEGKGLWAIDGIKEELLAALLGREGRRRWNERNPHTNESPYYPE